MPEVCEEDILRSGILLNEAEQEWQLQARNVLSTLELKINSNVNSNVGRRNQDHSSRTRQQPIRHSPRVHFQSHRYRTSLRVTAKSRILEPRLEKGNEYFELWSLYFVWIIILFDLEFDVTPVRVVVSLDLVQRPQFRSLVVSNFFLVWLHLLMVTFLLIGYGSWFSFSLFLSHFSFSILS